MLRNSVDSWGSAAKFLHWTIAALVFAQIALGFMAVAWRLSPVKLDLYVWHKSTGLLILVLMLVRLAWRWANPVPSLPAGMAPIERTAARFGHRLFYVLLIAMPLSGWIIASASGIPSNIFWLMPLPSVVAPDKGIERLASLVHLSLFLLLALLLVAHMGAALRHHFLRRDELLARMLPGRGRAGR
jgi:cytochrome b561